MKKLQRYTSKGGYTFNVIDRVGDVALAKSCPSVGFEVFHVQSHNGRGFAGKWFEPAEYAPSNEQFGEKGWSFRNEVAAREKFNLLVSQFAAITENPK